MFFFGLNINENLNIFEALTKVYGIGHHFSINTLYILGFSRRVSIKYFSDLNLIILHYYILGRIKINATLYKETKGNIHMLIQMLCYRGVRHKYHLPTKGQRTHTNAKKKP